MKKSVFVTGILLCGLCGFASGFFFGDSLLSQASSGGGEEITLEPMQFVSPVNGAQFGGGGGSCGS